MPNQNMQGLAGILAEQGRYGDTMLMHVAPSEVEYLAGLGGITENPMTGLPEAFKFRDLLPFVGSAFLGPAFKAVGFSPGVSSFLATTASTMLGGGSLEKGIMSGLVSSSLGRLGKNLSDLGPDAAVDAATGQPIADTGYKFGIFKKPESGTFGSRYSQAFQSPEFNPVQMVKAAGEAGLDNLLEQVQKPSVMLPFMIGAGELGRIKAEEDYTRQYQNMLDEQAERRRKIRERNPQILPPSSPYYRPPGMAQGGAVERKYDGYSFDPFSFDEYIPDEILPGGVTPVQETNEEPVPVDRTLPEEPVYQPEPPTEQQVIDQALINSLFVPGSDIPQSTGINTAALDDLFANLRKTEALQNLALEPSLLQQGFTGTSGVTAPPAGAGVFATPTQAEQPAIDFDVSPEMAAALQQVARPAEITREEIQAIQDNPRVQALQRISDLLKNNEFGAAFDEALKAERELGGDFIGNIVDANKLRELRGPMNADEITKFYNEMPQDVFVERYVGPGNEFKKDQAIERNIAALGGQAGYVDPMLGLKKEETLLGKLPIKELTALAAAAMGATAIPGLFGGAGGGATAGGATAGGASVAGGASTLTGVVPTGLVSGTTAAAVAAAGVPLAEVTIIASKLALSIPQAAALISSVGLGAAQALAGGTAAPATTVAQTTPTQPTGLETPLDEVVVTGSRAIDPALLRLVPGSLASTNLIQGATDIPTDIYGQPEAVPADYAGEYTISTGNPDIPFITIPAAAAATTALSGASTAPASQVPADYAGEYTISTGNPDIPYITIPAAAAVTTAAPSGAGAASSTQSPPDPLDEVVVRGTKAPVTPLDIAAIGGGLTASQILQGFTQPSVNPVTGEPVKTPEVEQIDITKPETSLLDTLINKGKGALTDLATSQLLGSLAGAMTGGATGGVGAGGGGYAGTGGLGVIPEGQERRYLAAPGDYRHGFSPEFLFFENLNPPAVDIATPDSTPGTTPGTPDRPGTIDDRIEPKATGGKIKSYSPRGYLDLIQGYQAGGEIEDIEEEVAEYSEAPMTDGSRGLIQLAQAAILGQLAEDQTDDVIQKFIDLHGNKAFRELREKTLESVANGSRKEGMIEGHTGGMDDMVDGVIGSSERVAVSPGEFIIPADVVSMLGDGNSDSGRTKLEQMMSRVRQDKTGSTKQAKPINSAKVLPA